MDSVYEWAPRNSIEELFRTGSIFNTNVNFRGQSSDGKLSYNVNYGNLDDEGFTPNNNLRRSSLSFGGRMALSNRFTVNGTLNYSQTRFNSPPIAAASGGTAGANSLYDVVFFTPRLIEYYRASIC